MKRVFEIMQQCSWEEVWEALMALYPSQLKNKPAYMKALQKISAITPIFTDQQLIIREQPFDKSNSESLIKNETEEHLLPANDVYLINECDPVSPHYSLMYVSWAEILGLKVPYINESKYGRAGIVAHSLYEMTFDGFSAKAIDMVRWKATKKYYLTKRNRHYFRRSYFTK